MTELRGQSPRSPTEGIDGSAGRGHARPAHEWGRRGPPASPPFPKEPDQQLDRSEDERADADERDFGQKEAHDSRQCEDRSDDHMADDQAPPPYSAWAAEGMKASFDYRAYVGCFGFVRPFLWTHTAI